MRTARPQIEQNAIRVWERLQLVVGKDGREGVYSCRVSDIKDDRLIISRPVFSYGHSLLANNRRVHANFTRADASYSFTARIRETTPKSPDEMYLVELGDIRRLQRRRFVRLEKMIKVGFMRLFKPIREKIEPEPEAFEEIRTINISAGGLLIPVDGEDIARDDLLLLDFSKSGLRTLNCYLIAVVRHVRLDNEKRQIAGVEFVLNEDLKLYLNHSDLTRLPEEVNHFTLHVQNSLVSEMFNEQLEMRQKGLI